MCQCQRRTLAARVHRRHERPPLVPRRAGRRAVGARTPGVVAPAIPIRGPRRGAHRRTGPLRRPIVARRPAGPVRPGPSGSAAGIPAGMSRGRRRRNPAQRRVRLTAVSTAAAGWRGAWSQSRSMITSFGTTAPSARARMASNRRSRIPPSARSRELLVASLHGQGADEPDTHRHCVECRSRKDPRRAVRHAARMIDSVRESSDRRDERHDERRSE